MNSPAYIPYTASLRAFLFAAYDDGLVELELACADGHRYRWEPVAPNPTYSAPERPDPSPWRVINLTDGAEFHSRYLPWPETPTGLDGPVDATVAHITRERYCDDAWARRLALKLGLPDAVPAPGQLRDLIDASPYAARLHLAPGFRVEKPWWQQGWCVRAQDDRPHSPELPTLAEAVAYSLTNGASTSALAPGHPSEAFARDRLQQRIQAWEIDVAGCRGLVRGKPEASSPVFGDAQRATSPTL